MTFTYDLANADPDLVLVSQVRLEIGDKNQGVGVEPNNGNLTDEEILLWLSQESNNVMHASIRACDALAKAWAKVPDLSVAGRSENTSKVSEQWAKMRDDMIKNHGRPSAMTGGFFSHTPTRADGYHDNYITASEYTVDE